MVLVGVSCAAAGVCVGGGVEVGFAIGGEEIGVHSRYVMEGLGEVVEIAEHKVILLDVVVVSVSHTICSVCPC